MKIIILFFFLTGQNATLQASEIYAVCKGKPSTFERLFTDATKIREKCIKDIYDEEKRKTEQEIEALYALNKSLDIELKKVAYKFDYNLVRCRAEGDEKANDSRTKKCGEIVTAKNSILTRIDKLNGWEIKPDFRDVNKDANLDSLKPPCPSQEELNKMQAGRYFNSKLYKTWERCVTLAQ
ncbi:MAG: hypothetical protein Q7U04_07455 [Bacteriovorax sp.]|nr:hypothetical protein [Bacteriovorax sp.]